MIQKIRGTIDILPEEIPYYRFIESTARKVAEKYGFSEIRTPTFESTELFRRGVGNTTDVVQKEMYTFYDNDNRSITLRPEGTASVARALIEHGRCQDTLPIKLYYLINCFRYEAPQAGRSREFFQFGVELFGAGGPSADATIVALAAAVIRELGIRGVTLHLNSIGCPDCRPDYREALIAYFSQYRDRLCESCKNRLEVNPLRLLDCKNESCATLAAGAPKILDYLCGECADHFAKLKAYLDDMGLAYQINPNIVRGLDYYTRTVFEFIAEGIGAQSTVCGGGRYDGLIAELGGPQLPGIGFAMGITRLILAMKQSGVTVPEAPKPALYIASLGEAAGRRALAIVEALRERGVFAECDLMGRSLKAQMKYADKIGAAYTLILGDNELAGGRAQLRSMAESAQKEIDIDRIENILAALNA